MRFKRPIPILLPILVCTWTIAIMIGTFTSIFTLDLRPQANKNFLYLQAFIMVMFVIWSTYLVIIYKRKE